MRHALAAALTAMGCSSTYYTAQTDAGPTDSAIDPRSATTTSEPAPTLCQTIAPEGGTGDVCAASPVCVNAGLGSAAFTWAQDGDTATVLQSSAGGWYVDTAIHVANTHPLVQVFATLTLVDSGEVISGADGVGTGAGADLNLVQVKLVEDGICQGDAWGLVAAIDDLNDDNPTQEAICALDGQQATLHVEVTDVADDRTAEDSAVVVLAVDPAACP